MSTKHPLPAPVLYSPSPSRFDLTYHFIFSPYALSNPLSAPNTHPSPLVTFSQEDAIHRGWGAEELGVRGGTQRRQHGARGHLSKSACAVGLQICDAWHGVLSVPVAKRLSYGHRGAVLPPHTRCGALCTAASNSTKPPCHASSHHVSRLLRVLQQKGTAHNERRAPQTITHTKRALIALTSCPRPARPAVAAASSKGRAVREGSNPRALRL